MHSFADKPALRRHFLGLRAALPAEAREDAERQIASRVLPLIPPGLCVAGYAMMRGEVDVSPLLEILARRGDTLCLPCVAEANAPLQFRAWTPGALLTPGAHFAPEPQAQCNGLTPQLLLVPLLAFTRQGYRLGYGGGYYDRTLAALRRQTPELMAIGVAFACQEAAFAPEPHDAPLNAIVTERETLILPLARP